jgi:hypothetical protein
LFYYTDKYFMETFGDSLTRSEWITEKNLSPILAGIQHWSLRFHINFSSLFYLSSIPNFNTNLKLKFGWERIRFGETRR